MAEKLALLHRVSVEEGGEKLVRHGRHLYDVYQLLSSQEVTAKLRSAPERVRELAADSDEHSEKWGWPFAPRPEGGYAQSPAFAEGSPAVYLRRGLEVAKALIYGPIPSFEECIAVVRASAEVL